MIFAEDAFAGRRILVTGASSGLGQAAAMLLAQCGAELILVGRDEGRLQQTEGSLKAGNHQVRSADLTDADKAAELVQRVASEGGPLHGIFHSAGTTLVLPVRLTKSHHLNDLFGAAVFGALGVARAAAKKNVVADGGSVVFMSSISSLRGRPGMVGYSAAKAATDGMVRALATELAPRKIRANSIVAGAVETQMHQDFVESVDEATVAAYRDLHLLGFGRPRDIANAVAFLLSDAARWITGTNLMVDGGYSAK
jgi:NAD(P)-dependent dehydrogenase (short-subunit alcohol dehydrogenase family)